VIYASAVLFNINIDELINSSQESDLGCYMGRNMLVVLYMHMTYYYWQPL